MRRRRYLSRRVEATVGLCAAVFALVGAIRIGSPGPVAARGNEAVGDTLHVISRAGFGGWWVESDLDLPHGESVIRQGLYGQRNFETAFGRRSRVAWAPGARGAAWTLPQILLGSGFDSFITGAVPWNAETDYPYNEFYWEGNDGSRIFTYRPYLFPDDLDPELLAAKLENQVVDRADRHVIALAEGGDPGTDRTEQAVRSVIGAGPDRLFPVVRFSVPGEAMDDVRLGIPADSVTVWRDELAFEDRRGPSARQSGLGARSRAAEVGLQTAEALAAIASGLPGAPAYPRERLGSAWRQVLFNQSRDILSGSGASAVRTDPHARYDSAAATIDSVVQENFTTVRAQMDTRAESGAAYVLFNPLGHARVGPALIQISNPTPEGEPESARRSHTLALVSVPEVPALGAVVIPIGMDGLPGVPASGLTPPAAGDVWMENAFLRVEIDPRSGAITHLLDKSNARQALRSGGRANVLWVQEELAVRPEGRDTVRREITKLLSLSSSVTARAATMTILRQWGSSMVRQELVLGRSAPFLEIRSEVEWNEDQLELTVAFEPAVAPDTATFEIPYGTIGRSGRPRSGAERARSEVPGQRWADVSAFGYGFSVLTDSGHGWEYRDGTLQLILLRSRGETDASPRSPGSLGDSSRHTFRYAIYPHAGNWLQAGTHHLATEYNVPLVVGIEPSHSGRLGKRFSFLSTDHPTVGVEWVKRAEDSQALIIRVVEWGGEAAEAEVASACPKITARRANHLEDSGDLLSSSRGGFRIRLRPHEIATVIVECRP
jgi:alpha-mannosidase